MLSPFCEKANTNVTSCPDIPTFDIVDAEAYAGLWYEIGSTAQFKLITEAGLSCSQVNYTVRVSHDLNQGATLSVVNSGLRAIGPVSTLGVTSINRGSKDVCEGARDVCSVLGSGSDLLQCVEELCKVAYLISDGHPREAEVLRSTGKEISGYAYNISKEIPKLAKHLKQIQIIDGAISQANGRAKDNVEKIKLEVISATKYVAEIQEFVKEMTAARKCLVEVGACKAMFHYGAL